MEDRKLLIVLNMIPGIGPSRALNVFNRFKNFSTFYKATPEEFKNIPDIGVKMQAALLKYRQEIDPMEEISKAKKQGIEIITLVDDDYPLLLKQIYDPPPVLYILGDISVLYKNSVAIVGTRKASTYGRKAAFNFAKELATININVVSGMARGVDSFAHKGAIDAGGPTTAVLGCGLDIVYPPENSKLMNTIARHGCVVSSFPMGTKPIPTNFPARNRIISGLSLGTLVVEAATRSGSLITADFSLEQGREVFALPGNIMSPYSKGTNKLIKQGAKLVENVEDILEELYIGIDNDDISNNSVERKNPVNGDEEKILQLIDYNPTHFEEVLLNSKKTPREINIIATRLEIKGLITSLPGGYFVKV